MSKQTTTRVPRTDELPELVRRTVDAALNKKAFDIVVLDLRNSGAFTNFFVICSAQSPRQVKAIVDSVSKQLRVHEVQVSHVEGYDRAEWVLMDYFDFIVHVFNRDTRQFYDLERLWGSAARIEPAPPEA